MIEHDPQSIVNHEGRPVEMAFSVTHGRVSHYSDIVDYIVNTEVSRCQAEGFNPTKSQIDFLRKEVVRYAVIRRDVDTANKLRISKTSILNETDNSLSSRVKLQQ